MFRCGRLIQRCRACAWPLRLTDTLYYGTVLSVHSIWTELKLFRNDNSGRWLIYTAKRKPYMLGGILYGSHCYTTNICSSQTVCLRPIPTFWRIEGTCDMLLFTTYIYRTSSDRDRCCGCSLLCSNIGKIILSSLYPRWTKRGKKSITCMKKKRDVFVGCGCRFNVFIR